MKLILLILLTALLTGCAGYDTSVTAQYGEAKVGVTLHPKGLAK